MKELWIGDKVILLNSQRNGTFEGRAKDGRARVRVLNQIIVTSETNLEPFNESEKLPMLDYTEESTEKYDINARSSFKSEIDLHINTLAPELSNEAPQLILRKQLSECRRYMEHALRLNMKYVTIIHGLGRGELKKEVMHLLTEYSEVRYTLPKHNGGATEVWLK